MQDAGPLLVLAALAVGLGAAGWVSHRLRLPPALGYLAVGAAIAPALHQAKNLPFSADLLQEPAKIGILFLLFAIGLELDLKRLREVLRKGAVLLPLDILVPALLITAAGRLAGWSLAQAAILGLTCSLSSTIFGERLAGLPGFPLPARQRALGVLLAEDLAAVALLAVFAIVGRPGTAGATEWLAPVTSIATLLFLFVLLTATALLVVPRVLDAVARTHSHELMVLVGAAAVLGFGWLGVQAGSSELGALMAGVAAAEAGSRFVVRNGLQTVRDLALALFFFAAGLAFDLSAVAGHPFLVLGVAGLFLAAKLIVHLPAGIASGLSLDGAMRSALALGTVGEFNLILVAAAQAEGLAHPLLGTAVVGAMLVLLVASPLLLRAVPSMVGAGNQLPTGFRKRLSWFMQSVRASRNPKRDPGRRRVAAILAANLILLAGWATLAIGLGPQVVRRFPLFPFLAPALAIGIAVGVALPIMWGTYRSYRALVRSILHLEGKDATAAARAKARIVDVAVTATVAVLILPLTFLLPARSLPVLLAGLVVAIVLAGLAWRQLGGFHRALEATVTRVLGQDPEATAILDRVMEQYPWGVRFSAVALPAGSPVAGRTIGQARIDELTGATVAVLQRRGHEIVNPGATEHLYAGDTVVLMGDTHQLERAEALVVAHGDALRLTAQSRLATVAEVTIHAGSALVGLCLADADVHTRTGTLVVGVWPQAGRHPAPSRPDLMLREGDRLILLGSSLQVERARLLAEGEEQTSVVEAMDDAAAPAG